jgi:hypothetical protein
MGLSAINFLGAVRCPSQGRRQVAKLLELPPPAILVGNRIDGAVAPIHLIDFERDGTLRDRLGILRLLACYRTNLRAKACAIKTELEP